MARSIRKGPYVDPSLLKKIEKVKASGKKEVIKTWKRASVVTPEFVGLTLAVHDGRKFASVFVTENMVGHALGEFAPTRTFRMHSGQRKTEKTGPATPSAKASSAKTSSTKTSSAKTSSAKTSSAKASSTKASK
jgi:small subunit ribosomal protein S19